MVSNGDQADNYYMVVLETKQIITIFIMLVTSLKVLGIKKRINTATSIAACIMQGERVVMVVTWLTFI